MAVYSSLTHIVSSQGGFLARIMYVGDFLQSISKLDAYASTEKSIKGLVLILYHAKVLTKYVFIYQYLYYNAHRKHRNNV